jgi:hypothetical protein
MHHHHHPHDGFHWHDHAHGHSHAHPIHHRPHPIYSHPRPISRRSFLAAIGFGALSLRALAENAPNANLNGAPSLADVFKPFADRLDLRWDADYLYVGSNGMPDHPMMIGITAWQQQVPLPQNYYGDNAWRLPLHPVVAKNPLSAKTGFFRGAIALAVDGIPIFNPIKNDGRTDTFLAGELDEYGGHCGRADDYHYHVPPVFLEKIVGVGKPIGVALDGYLIYGSAEPDGSPIVPSTLDAFNGHDDGHGNYHYDSTRTYPYLNGGFHGEVTVAGGQVDPQPRCIPIRPAGLPLHGAIITGFTSPKPNTFALTYEVDEEQRHIVYSIEKDGTYHFDFVDGQGGHRYEVYRRGDHADHPHDNHP